MGRLMNKITSIKLLLYGVNVLNKLMWRVFFKKMRIVAVVLLTI